MGRSTQSIFKREYVNIWILHNARAFSDSLSKEEGKNVLSAVSIKCSGVVLHISLFHCSGRQDYMKDDPDFFVSGVVINY